MEIDNHADTCCLGSNFTPIYFTNYTCNVTPFSEEYSVMKDVPIASGVTAWDNPDTGETILLQVNQGLWFGDKLECSLINPQQCREYGIGICDDPYDPNGRPIGIMEYDTETFIPMEYSECLVKLRTRAPTTEEIQHHTLITMTSEAPWDPRRVGTKRKLRTEVEHRNIISSLKRQKVELRSESEFESYMTSCSTAYSDHHLLDRMVASVRVNHEAAIVTDDEESDTEDDRKVSLVKANERHTAIGPEELAKTFGIGIEAAQKTLKATTQLAIRSAKFPLSRRYRTDLLQSTCRRLNVLVHTDTMFATAKGLLGNTAAQVFTDGQYIYFCPMRTKKHAGRALVSFTEDVGIPDRIRFDQAKETMKEGTEFMKTIHKKHINKQMSEAYAHWQIRAEDAIRELKRKWKGLRQCRNIPRRLWEYGMTWCAETMSLTVRHGSDRTPKEMITGDTPDISEYTDFTFYDWVWFIQEPGGEEEPHLGRWLGVSHRVGSGMCYYVLKENGEVLSKTSVQHVTREELQTDDIRDRCSRWEEKLKKRLDTKDFVLEYKDTDPGTMYIDDIDGEDNSNWVTELEEDPMIPEADQFPTPDSVDEYINTMIMVPDGDGRQSGIVRKRMKTNDGTPIGTRNKNFLLDTRKYEVELSDGTTKEFYANQIAENMFAQCDEEGRHYNLLSEIVDYRREEGVAVPKEEGWIYQSNGRKSRKLTTKGWWLRVEWKEGTGDWIALKDMKESYPVETAEYAVQMKLHQEPAFAWWVNDVLKKRDRIIAKVKSRY